MTRIILVVLLAGCGRGGAACPRPPAWLQSTAGGAPGGGTCQVMR